MFCAVDAFKSGGKVAFDICAAAVGTSRLLSVAANLAGAALIAGGTGGVVVVELGSRAFLGDASAGPAGASGSHGPSERTGRSTVQEVSNDIQTSRITGHGVVSDIYPYSDIP